MGSSANFNVNLELPKVAVTGQVHEDSQAYCIFNNWETRDNLAKIKGAYGDGCDRRFSSKTPFGTWYCYAK